MTPELQAKPQETPTIQITSQIDLSVFQINIANYAIFGKERQANFGKSMAGIESGFTWKTRHRPDDHAGRLT